MIDYQINVPKVRRRWWQKPKPHVLAIFSFRYDFQLVPALLSNIAPIVDGWVSFDDRASRELYSDERKRRGALLQKARDLGADWLLAVDPDERFEARLADGIRRLIATRSCTAWSFDLREMYTETKYRIDGLWGTKRRTRLFSLADAKEPDGALLHGQWVAKIAGHRERHSGFNLYHLRMISPERRRLRRDLYKALDPENRYQTVGYDYLAEDDGAEFQTVPSGREYFPRHEEDGGTWAASSAALESLRRVSS